MGKSESTKITNEDTPFSKYTYTNPKSLSPEICTDIIQLFETELANKKCYKGVTGSGLNLKYKNTFDFQITQSTDPNWIKVKELLIKELHTNVKQYCNTLNQPPENNKYGFKAIYYDTLHINEVNLQMQKYDKEKGIFTYHNDFSIENDKHRVVVFLWYLNTVEVGGETELFGSTKIKPEMGKLLLFPACWCFPHCGTIPISDNKYIITGWIYTHNQKY